jgi:hypothetical protein
MRTLSITNKSKCEKIAYSHATVFYTKSLPEQLPYFSKIPHHTPYRDQASSTSGAVFVQVSSSGLRHVVIPLRVQHQ